MLANPGQYISSARLKTGVVQNFGFVDEVPKSIAWRDVHEVADSFRGKLSKAVFTSFDRARAKVDIEELSTAIEGKNTKALEDEILNSLEKNFMELVSPILTEIVKSSGVNAAATAKVKGTYRVAQFIMSFDTKNPLAESWARRRSGNLIKPIILESRQTIRNIIARGFSEGIPPVKSAVAIRSTVGLHWRLERAVWKARERLESAKGPGSILLGKVRVRVPISGATLEKAVEKYSTRLRNYRARMIARTETIAASNEGQRQLWVQARNQGLLTNEIRVWIFTGDARSCTVCEQLSGAVAEIDGVFPGELSGPPAHPNCRCSTGLSFRKAKEPISRERVPTKIGEPPIRKVIQQPRRVGDPSSLYKPLNPGERETLSKFSKDGVWTAERQELHDSIIKQKLKGFSGVENPESVVLGGGPASGKSTMMEKIGGVPKNTVSIDVDDIRTLLPEYAEGLQAGMSDIAAITHEEASYLAKQIVSKAGDLNYNVLLDGTGDGSFDGLVKKIMDMRARGAKRVVGQYVTVDTETAITRMVKRGQRTGRFVPESYVREVHAGISEVLPQVIQRGYFDEFTLWDNNGAQLIKVATAKGSRLTIHDQAAWERFLAKAKR